MPSDNLMTMLREGGAKCPTGKRGATFKRQTQSGIIVDEASWPLTINGVGIPTEKIDPLIGESDFTKQEKTVADLGFTLFVKRAKIGQAKHVRVRPRFDAWESSGTVTVFDESITLDVLKNIINFAGVYSGLGDWRPSSPRSPGPWGKFSSVVSEI